MSTTVLRQHAESEHAAELAALAVHDDRPRPPKWKLSPWAVTDYLLGKTLPDGTVISPKHVGDRRIIEVAVATLATDRALLLLGVPGTAKSWVSEHLSAAISGDSTLLIQGTSRHQRGIAALQLELRHVARQRTVRGRTSCPGQCSGRCAKASCAASKNSPVSHPTCRTRCVTMLSEKILPIPELAAEYGNRRVQCDRHRQQPRPRCERTIHRSPTPLQHRRPSAALNARRRGRNRPHRVSSMSKALALPAEPPALEEIRRVVTIFRELRSGATEDGKAKVKSPSGTLSTAEAISVMTNGLSLAGHFGNGRITAHDLAAGMVGAIVKDPSQDPVVFKEYLETVIKERAGWKDLYRACRERV